jgi:hypothetical protein
VLLALLVRIWTEVRADARVTIETNFGMMEDEPVDMSMRRACASGSNNFGR